MPQPELKGFESIEIPEVRAKAHELYDTQMDRIELGQTEVRLREELADLMQEHKLTKVSVDELLIEVVTEPAKPKVKVRKKPAGKKAKDDADE